MDLQRLYAVPPGHLLRDLVPPRFADDEVFTTDALVLTWVRGAPAAGVDVSTAAQLYKLDLDGAQVPSPIKNGVLKWSIFKERVKCIFKD